MLWLEAGATREVALPSTYLVTTLSTMAHHLSFAMPAIYDSLKKHQHLSSHVAWRVSFIVPFILITSVALGLVLLTDDTPTGKWADRAAAVPATHVGHAPQQSVVPTTGGIDDKPVVSGSISSNDEKKRSTSPTADVESGTGEVQVIDGYQHEVIVKPSPKEAFKVLFSLQTLVLCAGYFNSFGAELAVNSVLGAYYLKNFPRLGQTTSGRWAAMFGLLNIITRPLGGFIGDWLYKTTGGSLWAKKMWIHFVGVIAGIVIIVIGVLDTHNLDTMIGLVALFAIFLEAGNGANFALVPHVHPHANGKFIPSNKSRDISLTLIKESCLESLVHLATSVASCMPSFSDTIRPTMQRLFGSLAL